MTTGSSGFDLNVKVLSFKKNDIYNANNYYDTMSIAENLHKIYAQVLIFTTQDMFYWMNIIA